MASPKASISQRAFRTDIKGEWSDHPDSLRDLQAILTDLHMSGVKWFTLREPDLLNQMHYPLTSSVKTWGDTLTVLAKIIVEGLDKGYFEKFAKSKGAKGELKWSSISWVKEAMKCSGASDEVVDEVILPLRRLQELRTKLGGTQSAGSEAASLRAALLREHNTPRSHIEHLCEELLRSLNLLRNLS